MPKRKPEPRSTGPPPRRFGVRNFLDTLPWCDACGTWVRKHGHWDANGDCVSVKFHRSFDARVAALKGGTVGKGKHTDDGKVIPLDVKVGDLILFGKYSGSDIKDNGVEYLIMREDEVLGVIEGTTKKAKA